MNVGTSYTSSPNLFRPGAGYKSASAKMDVLKVKKVPLARFESQLNSAKRVDLQLYIPKFDLNFDFEVTKINWALDSKDILVNGHIDGQVAIDLTLSGEWTKGEKPNFILHSVNFGLVERGETPFAVYVTFTLWAILGLSVPVKIRIPLMDYDFDSTFGMELDQISSMLSQRQIAYKLMVIAATFGVKLPFPKKFISGEDMESIAFCFNAVTQRTFDWPADETEIGLVSTKASLETLKLMREHQPIQFLPEVIEKTIFGITFTVGLLGGLIQTPIVDNIEEYESKIAKFDDQLVVIKIRSAEGITKITSLNVPEFSEKRILPALRKLIQLDEELNALSLDRYFNLAGSTLDGLSDEEKEIVTTRPTLDEKAFDID